MRQASPSTLSIDGGNDAPASIEPVAPLDTGKRRLASLDLLRGLTVAGMIVVNASAALDAAGVKVFPVLLHAQWVGFTAADVVFPAFVTMVGVSIAVSGGGAPAPASRILFRTLKLIVLGLLLVNMYLPLAPAALWPPRLPGVLQRIGIVYAIVALVYPRTGWKSRAVAAAVLLLGYWALCRTPLPDGSPSDLYVQGQNLVSWMDRRVFGTWLGVKGPNGYDPEGLLSTLPVIAQGLIGTLAGEYLRRGHPIGRATKTLTLAGVASILTGLVWSLSFPLAKPIWTSSFVLVTAGITVTALGLFHAWSDGAGRRPPVRGGILGSFGRNAIAAYALHLLLIQLVMTPWFRGPINPLAPLVGEHWAALAPVGLFLALIWLPMAILDRRGKYFRI